VLLALLTLLCPRRASADEAQALERVRAAFDAANFDEARALLAKLFDPTAPPCEGEVKENCRLTTDALIERGHAYDAASLLAQKKTKEADKVIGDIFRNNPSYVPSSRLFPQEIVDQFQLIRGRMDPELQELIEKRRREAEKKRDAERKAREDEEKRVKELERLATEETIVRTNSRVIALIPFGVGQFQNGNIPGGVGFAVTEVVGLTLAVVPYALAANLTARFPTTSVQPVNDRLSLYATWNRIAFAAWASLTVAGILHAQFTFVPETVTVRKRKMPDPPKVVPVVAPSPHGANVGLGGTF
jgi:hypothetical protein